MVRSLEERNDESQRLLQRGTRLLVLAAIIVGVSTGIALIDVFIPESLWHLWTLGYVVTVGTVFWAFRSVRASAYIPE